LATGEAHPSARLAQQHVASEAKRSTRGVYHDLWGRHLNLFTRMPLTFPMVLLFFACLRDLRELRVKCSVCRHLGASGQPAGSREAREAREETRRTDKIA